MSVQIDNETAWRAQIAKYLVKYEAACVVYFEKMTDSDGLVAHDHAQAMARRVELASIGLARAIERGTADSLHRARERAGLTYNRRALAALD